MESITDKELNKSASETMTSDGMVRKYQTRNILLLVLQAGVFSFGWMALGVVQTPLYNWMHLKNSTIGFLGSVSYVSVIGLMLSPLISKRFQRKKILAFLLLLPCLWSCGAVGVAILLSMHFGHSWLPLAVITCTMLWPFFSGWANIPAQEYIANCISKENIGTFVGIAQLVAPLLGLLGGTVLTFLATRMGVPQWYAMGFLMAFLLAQISGIVALFAHETQTPPVRREPFWRPALDAFSADKIFRRLLVVSAVVSGVVWLPYTFIPLLAIREWGYPDWFVGIRYTVFMGAGSLGAFLTTVIGRRFGYVIALKIAIIILAISLIPLVIPRIGPESISIGCARFVIQAALYGTAFTMLSSAFGSLMFILAPIDRRAGYFAAYNSVQMFAPGIYVLISGFIFVAGHYQLVFAALIVPAALLTIFSSRLLMPILRVEMEGKNKEPSTNSN
jgi:MFS family permease